MDGFAGMMNWFSGFVRIGGVQPPSILGEISRPSTVCVFQTLPTKLEMAKTFFCGRSMLNGFCWV